MAMKLYVGNLLFATSSSDLEYLFGQAGTVESAWIATNLSGDSRGYGFVEMATQEQGFAAITQFHGKRFNGSQLIVNEEKPPSIAAANVNQPDCLHYA